jgi:hypothetical protein
MTLPDVGHPAQAGNEIENHFRVCGPYWAGCPTQASLTLIGRPSNKTDLHMLKACYIRIFSKKGIKKNRKRGASWENLEKWVPPAR